MAESYIEEFITLINNLNYEIPSRKNQIDRLTTKAKVISEEIERELFV